MQIGPPSLKRLDSGGSGVACAIKSRAGDDAASEIFFRTSEPLANVEQDSGILLIDPFVCVALVPAMRTHQDITAASPVSAGLAAALPKVQSIFSGWYPYLKPARLQAPLLDESPRAGRGIGCFFSGGVDSFHSALRHADEIDTFIFVHGFDFPLAKTEFGAHVSGRLREAATAFGKRLVEVETNLRPWVEPYGNWSTHTHGVGLAAVAHLLAGSLRKVYVPSSNNYIDVAWGSHPRLDPLWSTPTLQVVYDDDARISRFAKTAHIAGSDVALAHLRVCWRSLGEAYNCGRCEKCLRTMLSLRVAGALDRCPTFDAPLDLSRVPEACCVTSRACLRIYRDILEAAQAAGDREVVRAIRPILSTRRRVVHWVNRKKQWLQRRMSGVRRDGAGTGT